MSQDDDIPPLDPKKVAVFVLLLGMIAFASWRYWQARQAVAAVAEASKDYRKLFPSRAAQAPPSAPKPVFAEAPPSGMMLKIDEDMRAPRPAPSAPPPQAPLQPEPAPASVAAAKAEAAVPVKPAGKVFQRPRLNSGAFSGLNGGAGVGFSGSAMSGGGGGSAPAIPATADIPGMPAAEKK